VALGSVAFGSVAFGYGALPALSEAMKQGMQNSETLSYTYCLIQLAIPVNS